MKTKLKYLKEPEPVFKYSLLPFLRKVSWVAACLLGNYTQALEDFRECLKLQVKHLDSDSRLLAETHYQLGLTYSLDVQYSQAIEALRSSISVIRRRLGKRLTRSQPRSLKPLVCQRSHFVRQTDCRRCSTGPRVRMLCQTRGRRWRSWRLCCQKSRRRWRTPQSAWRWPARLLRMGRLRR